MADDGWPLAEIQRPFNRDSLCLFSGDNFNPNGTPADGYPPSAILTKGDWIWIAAEAGWRNVAYRLDQTY